MKLDKTMTMKLLFRHTNTKLSLAGFARQAVVLLAVFCYVGAAWGEVVNISTGAIDGAGKIAEYNEIKTTYPVNASALLPAIAVWSGEMRENSAEQHWNGIDPSSYWEQTVDTWNSDNWTRSKSITVHLPEGDYVLIGACRSSVNADAYISVNGTQVLTPKGNTGLGITTDGRPSFNTSDTYANGGNGWGWQYRYIKFQVVNGAADVTIAIGGGTTTSINQWMSFTQPQLFTKSNTNGAFVLGSPYTFKLYPANPAMYLNLTDGGAVISNTPQQLYFVKTYGTDMYYVTDFTHYLGTSDNESATTASEDRKPMSVFDLRNNGYPVGCFTLSCVNDRYVGVDYQNGSTTCMVNRGRYNNGIEDENNVWGISASYILTDLTQEMYKNWSGYGADATPTGNTGCAYGFGTSTEYVYGDMGVHGNNYADLSKYGKLELTVTDGTPRLLFNRQGDEGSYIEINSAGDYATVDGNKWTIDLEKIVHDYGYAHLNCIKGNWADVTITSAVLTVPDNYVLQSNDLRPNEITHRTSYLYQYAEQFADLDLELQGLASDAESDWKNHENGTQRVNQFEITHYLKEGKEAFYLMPTAQNTNDHTMYQRWYNYDNEEDIQSILDHVTLNGEGGAGVDYFLYKNGVVTGSGIYWGNYHNEGNTQYAQLNFKYKNTDGRNMTVAADVSRYSDMTYENTASKLEGNLEEPSLTMRYIYYMKDAREMATKLTSYPEKNTETEKQNDKNWMESKVFHFPSRSLAYESSKNVGFRGEFIGLRHIFSDYWIFDNTVNENTTFEELNNHLISVTDGNTSGNIVVEISDPNGTGIRLGGYYPGQNRDDTSEPSDDQYKGYYYHDKMSPPWSSVDDYGSSRFLVFRYPATGQVSATNKPVYLRAYFVDPTNSSRRFQLAQYTIIFDKDGEEDFATIPWTSVNGGRSVQGTGRDPNQLRAKAGKPIAKITFDYPAGSTYRFPDFGYSNHGQSGGTNWPPGSTIPDSSPIPLNFDKSNYAFDGENSLFGAYALLSNMSTRWGNQITCVPANAETYGYDIRPDDGYQSGFLYIDASELPGDICSAPFVGDFCSGDELMISGWISGANNVKNGSGRPSDGGGDGIRSPGGITLTLKGEHNVHNPDGSIVYENGKPKKETVTLYRFCPGMCYELDNGTGVDGFTDANHVVWQQFYFEFKVTDKYDRHWIEVNNNCVSSQGGDFMLDNIEVYAVIPEIIPDINTPLCVSVDAEGNTVTDMRLLKLSIDHNKLKSSAHLASGAKGELGLTFLDKYKFLEEFRDGENGLKTLTSTQKENLHLSAFDFNTITLDELADAIEGGDFNGVTGDLQAYRDAFDAAILGNKTTWHSKDPVSETTNPMNSSIMYFQYDSEFTNMPLYSFADAVSKKAAVFREVVDGENYVVMNGNFPGLQFRANTEYYVINTNIPITYPNTTGQQYSNFNICSDCVKTRTFMIEPPMTILGLEKSGETNDYVVCEGKIPTLVTELKGFDFNGNEVPMQDINYDWWLGDFSDPNNPVLATLDNYHTQKKGDTRLDKALSTLRMYYPDATDLGGIRKEVEHSPDPKLTLAMIDYLQELVDKGQLVLHQRSITVPAEPTSADDPYFYLVACPIHDDQFKRALYHEGPASLIRNGNMETLDASSFRMIDPSYSAPVPVTFTKGVGMNGSQGIKITSSGKTSASDWDTQFFIKSNEVIPKGTTFHLEFDYRASETSRAQTQAHAAPGTYIHWNMLGDLYFTDEWKHFSGDITVSDDMGGASDNFQTIAFNLWLDANSTNPSCRTPRDYYFDNIVMTVYKEQYVAFFCDEPQGLRVKVGEKAPTLKTGFVPGENTFDNYDYSAANNVVLSIRLAKKEQFETVKHGTVDEAPTDDYNETAASDIHFLWLPIRDAQTQDASRVIRKSADYNVYLASTNDPVNDKTISTEMKKGSLPIVGKIVQLNAINTAGDSHLDEQIDENRLCIYFTENFEVREGYSYTLSLPFQENEGSNSCDGNILINLKIVPDYEVWTGGAGNTDWNNDENWRRADGNLTAPIAESQDESKRNNNELYRTNNLPNESPLKDYVTNYANYRTAMDRILRKGFAPLYCTHVLIKSNEWGDAPVLYDAIDGHEINPETGSKLINLPFPNLRETSTPILKFDMQARHYQLWEATYGEPSNKGREGDLIAEMYQVNSCDEIAMQPGTELRNAHLLNYNSAWMEFQLDTKRWYLLGSPLQGTISGEWYAPTGNLPQQRTTYYEPVTFGDGYDRYSPAIYQRSWDKAKAVLYEVGSNYAITDDDDDESNGQTPNLGTVSPGQWSNNTPNATWTPNGGADDYLDRLGYKPMGGKKANVAIKGIWSNTYNDAQVDYATGGFSVMVMNHLKGNDADVEAIIRLPKEDTFYDYYGFDRKGGDNVNQYEDIGTNTQLSDVRGKGRALNRGRLKADLLLPEIEDGDENKIIQKTEATASRYGDKRTYTRIPIKEADLTAMNDETFSFTEKVAAGKSDLGYYLVENPFPCGLDMAKFFAANSVNFTDEEIEAATSPENPAYGKTTDDVKEGLEKKYWLLTKAAGGQNPRQVLVQEAPNGEWITSDGTNVGTAIEYPDPNNNTKTLKFYPDAVLAPGQGFFVQAVTGTSGDIDITFTDDMQAQTRFGVKDNENGTKYRILVGQTQVTDKMYDANDDGIPETLLPAAVADNYEAGDIYKVDINGDETLEEKIVYEVPQYDGDGNPVLDPIYEDVYIYSYKKETLTLEDQSKVNKEYPLKGRTRGKAANLAGLVITAERDGDQTSALVMQREGASNDFLPSEDTETFITSDFESVPTVYTLCGRLATTINSIHDFRSLPLGVESNSDAPCTLTFQGVEALGDSISFYDAMEQTLTPLKSGMQFSVSGQTQNRYYLVRSLNKKDAAEETHLQIFTEGLTAKVIASTAEPILSVRCFDTAGRLIHSASPQSTEYSFTLPRTGIYIIEAETENDRKTKKVMVK